ncbi:hypothetical protein AOQ84DRAFT_29218 [Glonium stellatum]|uniref:T6SS Phospholipase effector Tle1-like catalytic domain-containing protein n=1 Tax=Glonium stellatum TaxID=574774 RepID=A0A8E2F232_9PEZI|nr:hypothetical protein AOQ84DRAFT_29218 [Glonium stellatum]
MVRNKIILLDGTWADRHSDRLTIIQGLNQLIPKAQNDVYYQSGIGSNNTWARKYISGATGEGLKRNVLEAFAHIGENYSRERGDRLVIIGYSRGAYTARSLAGLLSLVGVPGGKNSKLNRKLYDRYVRGDLKKRGVAEYMKRRHECEDVVIDVLCCFDTVGSLGIPRTGLSGVLRLSGLLSKKHEFHQTDPAPNILNTFHALALHESRKPYTPTLMHIRNGDKRNLKQVWFPGTHGDIGWENESNTGGFNLVDIVLAWTMQQLQDSISLEFDESQLRKRFPCYDPNPERTINISSDASNAQWVHGRMSRRRFGLTSFTRSKQRVPGGYFRYDMDTNEVIHPSVRFRGYGAYEKNEAINGFCLDKDDDGIYSWLEVSNTKAQKSRLRRVNRLRRSSTAVSVDALRIPEAAMGSLEARLFGFRIVRDAPVSSIIASMHGSEDSAHSTGWKSDDQNGTDGVSRRPAAHHRHSNV